MKTLLLEMNQAVKEAGEKLPENEPHDYYARYQAVLAQGDLECSCPEPTLVEGKKKRGPIKKSKSRNLLERLSDVEKDTLRFLDDIDVPFTNNLTDGRGSD